MIDNFLVEDENTVISHIVEHFKAQFAEPVKVRHTLDGLSFTHIAEN